MVHGRTSHAKPRISLFAVMGSVSGSNVDQPFKDLLEGVERLDRLLWDALEIPLG